MRNKGILLLSCLGILGSFVSCNQDKEEDILIIDYYPVAYEILVVNSDGENLLDESTPGNILNTEMYIELSGERFDVHYGRSEDDIFPYPTTTRAYMPMWYGAFIFPYWYPYPDLPERDNRLYVGEFPGDAHGEVKFKLSLDGHSYEISYVNKKISGLDVERHYYLDGKEISSSSFTLTL